MRETLNTKLRYLRTKKFQISLVILIPALFVLFVFGTSYVALDAVGALQRRSTGLPAESLQAIQRTHHLLKLMMGISLAASLAAGLLLAYSILSSIKKILSGRDGLLITGAVLEPDGRFGILGRDVGAMMSSLSHYVSILEGMSGGVIAFDRDGRVAAVNPSAERMFGRGSKELVGRSLAALSRDIAQSPKLEQVILDGLQRDVRYASEEISLRTGIGQSIAIGLTTSLLKAPSGKTAGVIASIIDLTGVKKMHEDMQKRHRMASLGRLAAGVAHEVRNPLGAIKGMAQLIQESLAEDDSRRKYAAVIEQETNRLNRVVENLLGLSHSPHLPQQCDLWELLMQARELASSGLGGKKIDMLDERGTGVPRISGESERLKQAFINLFLNALEAVPEGGRMRVKTSFFPETNMAGVEIANTGPQIAADVLEHLFEPFFTTKESGSGLGLAIVHQIISDHGGTVSAGAAGEETVFRILLPAGTVDAPAPGARTA